MGKTSKTKTAFFCSNCGAQSPKWVGRCPACGQWNTYTEEVLERDSRESLWKSEERVHTPKSRPALIKDIESRPTPRIDTGNAELNRVLGGGLVPGSFVLIGGEPGIGKSTLMLQVALQMPDGQNILYVSGEESNQQLKMRGERLGLAQSNCYILTETCLDDIFTQAESLKPDILVADSIQTLYTTAIDSSAGSISQIKECAARLQRYAKETGVSVFVIGHITKEGNLAGPKILEHIVDTVLHFEGDRNYGYRILRSVKNRFGSTNEIGIYEMQTDGLRQVENPSEILLSQREEQLSGTAIAATLEGLRPIMVEVQALVSPTAYSVPQRSATGFDLRRLNMLLAVLEKRCGARLSQKDVFLNIAGGLKVDDPAIDLAVIAAVLSSGQDIPLSPRYCFAAEVGLTGEIRPVSRLDQRLAEAEKLGFERIFVSKYGLKGLEDRHLSQKVVPVSTLFELFQKISNPQQS
ncbi:MAG: DNA repair protein RadA [Bacteroidales bacterium]|nr:DNA repair protein RadA [Bacteroidales bacterium]MDE7072647.1 DNA repair protein RadA [Bacteroidales bacterium]